MSEIKIIIVDDHALMRAGLKSLLANQSDILVIGEAESGDAALLLIETAKPDIVLLDISMHGMNGLECLTSIKQRSPDIKVILLTMHEDISYLRQGFAAGAMGYVLKKAADDVLYHAIRTVFAGEVYIQSSMAQSLLTECKEPQPPIASPNTKPLSAQENKVLTLIALGYSNAEIAQQLMVSARTIETYKYRIMEKLQAKKRSDLVKYAIEQGIIVK
ncbi:response regulator transcription factor [Pelosinus sp. IPA-1]|uniref:response regulator transcription factor n=1 Tax=Pelosinus sp. IPA-1 TaxID=3029569 RepID=UPI00243618AA|nr:response regulator transcription factor [Pelosinus sp. IPA-1]GMB02246.1 DNA-binding response regulator [Pelosinus sp. IPA-1]